MIAASQLLAIAVVVLLGAMSPGPDFAVLLRRTAVSGRAAGLRCAMGMGVGIAIWVLAAGAGIAALLTASTVAFTVVKLAGAGCLIVLGCRAWLSPRAGADAPEPGTPTTTGAFREGLLCNLLNRRSPRTDLPLGGGGGRLDVTRIRAFGRWPSRGPA